MWDNNTHALFGAVTAPTRWAREHRARRAVRWLADLGNRRRAWVVERTAAAGVPVERLLLPPVPEPAHLRYWGDTIDTRFADLDPESAAWPAAEYDLPGAEFRRLAVERPGSGAPYARIVFALPRRYRQAARGPTELALHLPELTGLRFAGPDVAGLFPQAGPDGVVLGPGAGGELRGPAASLELTDLHWESSPTGRRYAAAHPERADPRIRRARGPYWWASEPGGRAEEAARVLRAAMLGIRMVGHSSVVHRTPVAAIAAGLSGAGRRILDAGAVRGRPEQDAAFRALTAQWLHRGGPDLVREVRDHLPGDLFPGDLLPADHACPDGPRPEPVPPRPVPSTLMLLHHGAAHHDPAPAPSFLQFQLAQAAGGPDTPWQLAGHRLEHPAVLHLTLDAFHRPAVPDVTPGRR
ncbi:hypothetical protein Kpho02_23220 [Kitasatospora phosalacinea]|uniref:Uncharacterized protein n=1 Tax=Kitasatospora phosalacinea TaxID=2065 RepID=A0A9W6V191_9ACTN|nr:hypothetical protein [Kitasatospora phosalacinea]GLW70023.1 hypothetical protein Kpho02_23220 [Kitasatospora phosalacinea]